MSAARPFQAFNHRGYMALFAAILSARAAWRDVRHLLLAPWAGDLSHGWSWTAANRSIRVGVVAFLAAISALAVGFIGPEWRSALGAFQNNAAGTGLQDQRRALRMFFSMARRAKNGDIGLVKGAVRSVGIVFNVVGLKAILRSAFCADTVRLHLSGRETQNGAGAPFAGASVPVRMGSAAFLLPNANGRACKAAVFLTVAVARRERSPAFRASSCFNHYRAPLHFDVDWAPALLQGRRLHGGLAFVRAEHDKRKNAAAQAVEFFGAAAASVTAYAAGRIKRFSLSRALGSRVWQSRHVIFNAGFG